MAQEVERILGKDEVTSSTLVSSSRNPVHFKWAGFLLHQYSQYVIISQSLIIKGMK